MKYRFLFGLLLTASLALLAACGGSGTGSSATSQPATATAPLSAHQVQVTVTDTDIKSSLDTFLANVPYDFTVTNKGTSPHDFIIQRRVQGPASGTQGDQGILYIVPALKPGATQRFNYAFPQASTQSQVRFIEHLAGQGTSAGPSLAIQVQRA